MSSSSSVPSPSLPDVRALDRLDLPWRHKVSPWCADRPSGKSALFAAWSFGKYRRRDIELAGKTSPFSACASAVGYVPQSFALYPHFTVYQNIAYPLALAHVARDEIARRIDRAAGILSIGHL